MHHELKKHIQTHPVDRGEFSAAFSFPETFVGFNGHFPGQPVLPGVCLIQAVLTAARQSTGRELVLSEVALAKFIAVVLPNQQIHAACKVDAEMVRAKLSHGDERVAEIRLRVRDA